VLPDVGTPQEAQEACGEGVHGLLPARLLAIPTAANPAGTSTARAAGPPPPLLTPHQHNSAYVSMRQQQAHHPAERRELSADAERTPMRGAWMRVHTHPSFPACKGAEEG